MSESENSSSVSANSAEEELIVIDGTPDETDVGIDADVPEFELADIKLQAQEILIQVVEWAQSPKFYAQVGIIIAHSTTWINIS